MTDLWTITEDAFDAAKQHHQETIFTLGNGYLSTRGAFEEGRPRYGWPRATICSRGRSGGCGPSLARAWTTGGTRGAWAATVRRSRPSTAG
ncbi:MAG TPA: hypothetical protein VI793_12000 [Anaerolineales bacterium]|nr:hypothetical protein [Anaerolineales bacterium]